MHRLRFLQLHFGNKSKDTLTSRDGVVNMSVKVESEDGEIWLPKALKMSGMTKSQNRARQLLEQGKVELNGVVVTDEKTVLRKGETYFVGLTHSHKDVTAVICVI